MTPQTPQALLNYVLGHLSVKSFPGSLQVQEHGYTLQRRTCEDYNFIHILRGRVVWVIEGHDHTLSPGDLVIVPPRIVHSGYSLTRRVTLGSAHIMASLPGGQDLFKLLIPPRQQHVDSGSKLDVYLRGGASEYQRADGDSLLFWPHWNQMIVLELLHDNARRGLLKWRVSDPLVAAMLEDLDQRITQPVTLEDLARRSGFSAQHLNRIFRRALGVTPLQYLARARMEQAARLLRDGRLTVRAIARNLGFDDPYYFSRVFTQHYGHSPARYRLAADSDSPSPRSARPFTRGTPRR